MYISSYFSHFLLLQSIIKIPKRYINILNNIKEHLLTEGAIAIFQQMNSIIKSRHFEFQIEVL